MNSPSSVPSRQVAFNFEEARPTTPGRAQLTGRRSQTEIHCDQRCECDTNDQSLSYDPESFRRITKTYYNTAAHLRRSDSQSTISTIAPPPIPAKRPSLAKSTPIGQRTSTMNLNAERNSSFTSTVPQLSALEATRILPEALDENDILYYQYIIFNSNLEMIPADDLDELTTTMSENLYSKNLSKKIKINYLKILFKLIKSFEKNNLKIELELEPLLMGLYEEEENETRMLILAILNTIIANKSDQFINHDLFNYIWPKAKLELERISTSGGISGRENSKVRVFYISIICNLFARDIELCNQFIKQEDWRAFIVGIKYEETIEGLFPMLCTLLILLNDSRGERFTLSPAVQQARMQSVVLIPVILNHIRSQINPVIGIGENGIKYRKQLNYSFLKIGTSFLRTVIFYGSDIDLNDSHNCIEVMKELYIRIYDIYQSDLPIDPSGVKCCALHVQEVMESTLSLIHNLSRYSCVEVGILVRRRTQVR